MKSWKENFNLVKEFIKKNNRLPSYKNKNEVKMYNWYTKYSNKHDRNELSKDKYNLFSELTEFKTNTYKDKFTQNLLKLCVFIETHNRLPKYKSKNTEERKIASWLYNTGKKYYKIINNNSDELKFNLKEINKHNTDDKLSITEDYLKNLHKIVIDELLKEHDIKKDNEIILNYLYNNKDIYDFFFKIILKKIRELNT